MDGRHLRVGEFCDLLYLHTPFGASRHNGIEWQRARHLTQSAERDVESLLTYDASRPHRIRIGFPPEDAERARVRLMAAVELMQSRLLELTTAAGTTLPAWDTPTDEDDDE
ncbi:hypothetical protein [Streptomyces sp. NPDC090036]|uniref:hypothetical protein n=1 Tax=Streptomyces sp. NPDC090036 TaxID=3365926 RepID=UPI00380026F4